MDVSANGGRVRFTRDIANIVMDLNDVETIDAKALGGADTLTVNDLSGTDLTNVDAGPRRAGGGDDAAADNVIVNATNGDDIVTVTGSGAQRAGRSASPRASTSSGAIAGSDRLTVNALAGDDVVDASGAGRERDRCSRSPAATATTSCSAAPATTRCSAAPATTSCSAARAPTSIDGGAGADWGLDPIHPERPKRR